MGYLLDFVKTFTDDELKQFRRLDLIGHEEILRDYYARNLREKNFNESGLAIKFGLSQSHFDKLNSVLLDKTIQAFYGHDYGEALFFILHKGLSDLVFHELRILERKVLKRSSAAEELKFYKAAFDVLRSMYHPNYNSKLTHSYGQKYLKALGRKKTITDEVYVAMISLYGDMVSADYSGTAKTFKSTAEKQLKKWEPQSKATAAARFYYNYVLGVYYKHLTED